jgi:hypothetical protein
MKNMYKIFTKFYRIKVIGHFLVHNTWMCCVRGGGKLGVTNHGRSRVKSFLQETEDKEVQQTPRNGVRPKQKSTVQDARDLLTDLPNFFSFVSVLVIILTLNSESLKAEESSQASANQTQVSSANQTSDQVAIQNVSTENLRILKKGQQRQMLSLEKNPKPLLFQQSSKKNFNLGTDSNPNPVDGDHKPPESERSKQVKKKIRSVAELYEKQFLRDMVKQMRSTVSFSDISKPSFAEGYFSEQLDQEYVEKWGDRGGIGLGDMIYQQLMSQYGSRMGVSNQ